MIYSYIDNFLQSYSIIIWPYSNFWIKHIQSHIEWRTVTLNLQGLPLIATATISSWMVFIKSSIFCLLSIVQSQFLNIVDMQDMIGLYTKLNWDILKFYILTSNRCYERPIFKGRLLSFDARRRSVIRFVEIETRYDNVISGWHNVGCPMRVFAILLQGRYLIVNEMKEIYFFHIFTFSRPLKRESTTLKIFFAQIFCSIWGVETIQFVIFKFWGWNSSNMPSLISIVSTHNSMRWLKINPYQGNERSFVQVVHYYKGNIFWSTKPLDQDLDPYFFWNTISSIYYSTNICNSSFL